MRIEDIAAFQFVFQEEIYLLNGDRDWYSNKMITGPADSPPVTGFSYLGGNKKNFLVIVHYPEAVYMDKMHLAALENTVKRLGFLLDDIAIFNRANYPDALSEQLMGYFNPQKLLLQGKKTLLPGMENLPVNKIQEIKNCRKLYTFSFAEMMDNTENKKVFWEQIKQL